MREVTNLTTDFEDGEVLLLLLESITKEPLLAKRKKKETYSLGKILRNLFFFAGICLLAYLYMRYRISPTQSSNPITARMILQRTLDNYQQEVDSIGDSFEVDPDYLLALIVLECSGRLRF